MKFFLIFLLVQFINADNNYKEKDTENILSWINHMKRILSSSGTTEEDFNDNVNNVEGVTSKEYHLKKTIFSDSIRLLVVAGLEGTGHHAISAMFNICARKKPALCEVEKGISTKTMQFNPSQKLVHGLFGAVDTAKSLRMAVAVKNNLVAVANRTGDHLYFLGLGGRKGSGMYSYPNYNGKFKSLDHPDIYQLGLLAEQAGVDYRVLVLQRNGMDVLKSVDRRDFGKGDEEPKILVDNAAVLHAQLALLDSRFYYCLQYEALNDLKKPSAVQDREDLVNFLHPRNLAGETFDLMLQQIRPPSKSHRSLSSLISNASSIEQITPLSGNSNTVIMKNSSHSQSFVNDMRSREHNSTMEYLTFQLNARLSMITDLCRQQRLQFQQLRKESTHSHKKVKTEKL